LILFGEIGRIFTARGEIHFERKQFSLEKFDAALREHESLYTSIHFQLKRFWEGAWNIKFIAQHAGVDIPALKNLPGLESVWVSFIFYFLFFIFYFLFFIFYFLFFIFYFYFVIIIFIIILFYKPIVQESGLDWRLHDATVDYQKQVSGAFGAVRARVEEQARFGLYYLTVPVPESERIKSFAILSNTMYYITGTFSQRTK